MKSIVKYFTISLPPPTSFIFNKCSDGPPIFNNEVTGSSLAMVMMIIIDTQAFPTTTIKEFRNAWGYLPDGARHQIDNKRPINTTLAGRIMSKRDMSNSLTFLDLAGGMKEWIRYNYSRYKVFEGYK